MTLSKQQVSHVRVFDVVRGTACLLVVLGHARALAFVDYPELPSPGWVVTAIYAATGLGEQAVVVFFLLSGYWVGGQAVSRAADGKFNVTEYLMARVSRIYTVLIPAVGLSLLPILIGLRAATNNESSGTASVVAASDGSWALSSLWSLLSIQPNLVPPPPGNSALWSLGIEFQTYVLFGFILLTVQTRHSTMRVVSLGVCTGIIYLLGVNGVGFALVWLIGLGIKFVPPPIRGPRKWQIVIAVLVVFMVAAVDSTDRFGPIARILLGLSGAWLLYVLSFWPKSAGRPGYVSRFLEWMGTWSFSLYAAHLPVMLTLVVAFGLERTASVHTGTYVAAFLVLGSLVLSFIFYLLTEKHTPAVRTKIRILTSKA